MATSVCWEAVKQRLENVPGLLQKMGKIYNYVIRNKNHLGSPRIRNVSVRYKSMFE